jgi:hypothetical protein
MGPLYSTYMRVPWRELIVRVVRSSRYKGTAAPPGHLRLRLCRTCSFLLFLATPFLPLFGSRSGDFAYPGDRLFLAFPFNRRGALDDSLPAKKASSITGDFFLRPYTFWRSVTPYPQKSRDTSIFETRLAFPPSCLIRIPVLRSNSTAPTPTMAVILVSASSATNHKGKRGWIVKETKNILPNILHTHRHREPQPMVPVR